MSILKIAFQLIGSLALLLYGMKMLSEGIQKGTSDSLHRFFKLMTNNRLAALLTGALITAVIQSSSAATVMTVSFVNGGLMTLQQSIGVIFGANIGTTVTAWIVAIFGFKFNIAAIAVPVFGIGYILRCFKKLRKESAGEALMGFGMLFIGLGLLSKSIPEFNPQNIAFLSTLPKGSILSICIGVFSGLVLTVIIHSSSAATAIILTMCHKGLLQWEFAAAMILGSNIGTTIDTVLASIGARINARRAALVHVLFNVSGSILAIAFFRPLLFLVDFVTPGSVESALTAHIAMLHTLFNTINALLFLPFTKRIAILTEKLIKPKPGDIPEDYKLEFIEVGNSVGARNSAEYHIMQVEKEISDMISIAVDMFSRIQNGFENRTEHFITEHFDFIKKREEYADRMQEQLSAYLHKCMELPLSGRQRNNINAMLHIVDEIENITDDCYSTAIHLKRSIEKRMKFDPQDMDRLHPYTNLVKQVLTFVNENINKPLSRDGFKAAQDLEDRIDMFRKNLKKVARKRLEEGADVKTELLYIDMVRDIEKIGDRAYSISEALSKTK